eukprot:TRINITY_DN4676_c0_g1_i1.p1 TRINITY_DN4676_c0_g1~~TRINITY_DN4676_c0_g1_i1.p1  ORF type:complete len:161 (+),score=39.51 TRINITY_DN4676_c0_g1_i1:112-594(+)
MPSVAEVLQGLEDRVGGLEAGQQRLQEELEAAWERGLLPEILFRVQAHREENGHTHYVVEGSLAPCGAVERELRWSTAKRLGHLRAQLHEPLKKALGKDYSSHFRETPFAHHCGLPGTTKRLDAWCQTLAVCMSTGMLSPPLIAQVLRELDAPPVPGQPA